MVPTKWLLRALSSKASSTLTLNKKLDVEAPTMSRLGRRAIYFWATAKGWKLFGADGKSAFLQSEDIVENQGLQIFGVPSADMR